MSLFSPCFSEINLSSSDLIRGSRLKESAVLSDLDTPVKPEYDWLTSPLRGEVALLRAGEGGILKPSLALPEFSGETLPCPP